MYKKLLMSNHERSPDTGTVPWFILKLTKKKTLKIYSLHNCVPA